MIDLDKGQSPNNTKGTGNSKGTQRGLGDLEGKNSTKRPNSPSVTIDVTPDGVEVSNDVTISGSVGIVSVSAQADGSIGITAKIPVPGVPGLTANGGIVINALTGEIESTSVGASFGIAEITTTIIGCDIITVFEIRIPNTIVGISYTIITELPNCKPKEEEEEEEEEEEIDTTEPGLPPLPDIPDDEIVLIANAGVSYRYSYAAAGGGLREFKHYKRSTIKILACWIPGVTFYTHWRNDNIPTQGLFEIIVQSSYIEYFNNGFQEEKEDTTRQQSLAGITLREFCDLAYLDSNQGGLFTSCHYGRWGDLKNKYYRDDQRKITRVQNQFTVDVSTLEPVLLYTFDRRQPASSPPPPPPRKKMDDCCAASTRMIRELHEFIKPQDLKNSKLPKRLIYPDGKGEEKVTCLGDFIRYLILEIDAKGFQPFSLEVRDTNAAQEGNQPLSITAYSLSAALKEILQYLIDTESDGDNANNMLVRLAYECSLIHKIAAVTQQQVDNIENFLDYEVRQEQVNLPMMFNMLAGVANKKKKGIDANDEVNTEAVMSELLQQVEHPIVVTKNVSRKQLTEALLELKQTMLTGGRDF